MSVYRSLKTFAELSGAERRLLLWSGALTAGLRILLRVLPFRQALRMTRHLAGSRPLRAGHAPAEHVSPERIIWAAKAAGRRLANRERPCLTEALALYVLLRRHGHAADLHIGVLKGGEGGLGAHAWVEHRGRVVIGELPNLSSYTPLPPLKL